MFPFCLILLFVVGTFAAAVPYAQNLLIQHPPQQHQFKQQPFQLQPPSLQPLQIQDYFSRFHGVLNCTKPSKKTLTSKRTFCDVYNAATKYHGVGTYNLHNNDMVLIDPFIFKWTYDSYGTRTMKVIWINSYGHPLLISNVVSYAPVTAEMPYLAAQEFHGIYFMTDLNQVMNGDSTNFVFTNSSSEALEWCNSRHISGCGVAFTDALPGETRYRTRNFVGFALSDYSFHIGYLTKSLQACYSKIKDSLTIEPVINPLHVRFILRDEGGGCSAGFGVITCVGTRDYTLAVQNIFQVDGRYYPELVDEGQCLDDSAQPHELSHVFVYGTPLQDMRGLNEGLADYMRHKNSYEVRVPVICLDNGYIAETSSIQPYMDLNTFRYDPSYYHTGECIWKYIEDTYGHDIFLAIMHRLDDLRFKPGTYSFFADIVNPIVGTDVLPTIRARFNLGSDQTIEKSL